MSRRILVGWRWRRSRISPSVPSAEAQADGSLAAGAEGLRGAGDRPAGLGQDHVVSPSRRDSALERSAAQHSVRRCRGAAIPGAGVFDAALAAARAPDCARCRGTMWTRPICRFTSGASGSRWPRASATRCRRSSLMCRWRFVWSATAQRDRIGERRRHAQDGREAEGAAVRRRL